MKKIIVVCLFVLLFSAAPSMAAEGEYSITDNSASGRPAVIEVVFTLTAGSPDFAAETMSTALTNKVKGWVLDEVEIDGNHSGTEPTENSDFYLYRNYGTNPGDIDVLGGGGVDQVDNTASRIVVPISGGIEKPIYMTSALTLVVSGNAENSAVVYVRLRFVNPYAR
jgi:hypothetical protein